MLERYERHVGARHLDVGVGTGGFSTTAAGRSSRPQITLLDLNNELAVGGIRPAPPLRTQRLSRRTCWIQSTWAMTSSTRSGRTSSSIAFPADWSGRPRRSRRTSAPTWTSGGVLFGTTILGRGVAHNLLGRRLLRLYNRKRIFSNLEDDQQGLERGLASELTEVEIDVVGAVALFVGRA